VLRLIREEVNVKDIIFDASIKEEVELDTEITEELKQEGMLRELTRAVQDARKKAGLTTEQKAVLIVFAGKEEKEFVQRFEAKIKDVANLSLVEFGDIKKEAPETKIDGMRMVLEIRV
jgi:isoleucyl-tRNA synthetase